MSSSSSSSSISSSEMDRDERVREAARRAAGAVCVSSDVPEVLNSADVADVHPIALAPLRPADAVKKIERKLIARTPERTRLVTSQSFSPLGRSDEDLVGLCFHMFEVLDLVAEEDDDKKGEGKGGGDGEKRRSGKAVGEAGNMRSGERKSKRRSSSRDDRAAEADSGASKSSKSSKSKKEHKSRRSRGSKADGRADDAGKRSSEKENGRASHKSSKKAAAAPAPASKTDGLADGDADVDIFKLPVRIQRRRVLGFLREVARRYRDVPYHNFRHATNVMQFVVFALTTCGARKHFPPIELLAVLVASLCHDLDHPGVNNAFLVNGKLPLAALYNDRAPLEQHHAAGTFRLLRIDHANVLHGLPPRAYDHVRKTIINCILATDLADHGKYLGALKDITAAGGDSWNEDMEQRGTVLLSILKGADISNEIRSAETGEQWAHLVVTEFFAQAQLEAERGLPVAPHMDPEKNTLAKAQVGFIKFLCVPLFSELCRVIEPLEAAREQMLENLKRWESLTET